MRNVVHKQYKCVIRQLIGSNHYCESFTLQSLNACYLSYSLAALTSFGFINATSSEQKTNLTWRTIHAITQTIIEHDITECILWLSPLTLSFTPKHELLGRKDINLGMGNKQRSKIESLDLVFSVHKNRQTTSRKEK